MRGGGEHPAHLLVGQEALDAEGASDPCSRGSASTGPRHHSRAAAVLAGEDHVHLLDARRRLSSRSRTPLSRRSSPNRSTATSSPSQAEAPRHGPTSTSTSSPPRRASPPYSPCGITDCLARLAATSTRRDPHSEWIHDPRRAAADQTRASADTRARRAGKVLCGVYNERPTRTPRSAAPSAPTERRPLLALAGAATSQRRARAGDPRRARAEVAEPR